MKAYKIKKLKSRRTIEIVQMDADDWFYKLKIFNGTKVTESGMIIKSQIQVYLDKYKIEGYSIIEEDI